MKRKDIVDYLNQNYYSVLDKKKEHFIVLLMDSDNKLIASENIGVGSANEVWIDLVTLFALLFKKKAKKLVMSHNHPKGTLKPSNYDLRLTSKVKGLCDSFSIELEDHIIFTESDYISLAEQDYLY